MCPVANGRKRNMADNLELTSTAGKEVRLSGGFMISGLATGHALFHWVIQSFVVLLPEVQIAFQLSAVGVGAILTVRELASAIVALPAGFIVDALRRHWGAILALCIGGVSLGSLVMGFSPAYPLLLAGVAIVAIAHSIWHLPASASLSRHFSERRGMALSFHGVGGSVGDVAGPLVAGAMLMVLGWRGILSVYATVPFFLAFLAAWSFKNIGGATEAQDAVIPLNTRIEMTKRLLANRVLWGIVLVRGLRAMSLVALLTVLPLYLGRDLELSPFSRGFHIGLLIAIGLVAKPVMGNLSDHLGRKQVLVPGLLWSCAISLLLIFFSQGVAFTVLIALLGLFLYPDQPIVTAAALDIVGRDVASTALGLISFASFFMSALSPLIAGGLYQSFGVDAALYYVAILFAMAAVVFAALPLATRPG